MSTSLPLITQGQAGKELLKALIARPDHVKIPDLKNYFKYIPEDTLKQEVIALCRSKHPEWMRILKAMVAQHRPQDQPPSQTPVEKDPPIYQASVSAPTLKHNKVLYGIYCSDQRVQNVRKATYQYLDFSIASDRLEPLIQDYTPNVGYTDNGSPPGSICSELRNQYSTTLTDVMTHEGVD